MTYDIYIYIHTSARFKSYLPVESRIFVRATVGGINFGILFIMHIYNVKEHFLGRPLGFSFNFLLV